MSIYIHTHTCLLINIYLQVSGLAHFLSLQCQTSCREGKRPLWPGDILEGFKKKVGLEQSPEEWLCLKWEGIAFQCESV